MPFLDFDHTGTKWEYKASVYTLDLYEQQFGGDLIQDVFGKVKAPNDTDNVILDFTSDNWNAEVRAFWCMLKTAEAIADAKGKRHKTVAPYSQWILSTDTIDLQEIGAAVVGECFRGFYPAIEKAAKEADKA